MASARLLRELHEASASFVPPHNAIWRQHACPALGRDEIVCHGRSLLTALIDVAQERGIHAMVAGIDADNTASIAFHHSLGFTEVARMPEIGRKFDRWLDFVLMQRILT